MSEINVTPFVDVMLVLLIVFMVTAPLLTVGIPVDLPKVKASALTDQKDPIEITVKLDGSVYLGESIVEVENYHYATSQLAQTTLRSVLGQVEMDGLLSERESLNKELQEILDTQTDPWGVKVSSVEVKHVDLPPDMQTAMARQA